MLVAAYKLQTAAEFHRGLSLSKTEVKIMTKQFKPLTRSILRSCQTCVQFFDCPGGGTGAVVCFPSVKNNF